MAKKSAVIRKGPSSARGSTDFISVKEDEPATIVPVLGTKDIVSIDLHAYWEINPAVTFPCLKGSPEKCPGCENGNKPAYRAFLPVLDGEGNLRVFAFGVSVERQLVTLEDELGEIVGKKLRVRRSGSGLGTKYQVINTGKDVKVEVDAAESGDFVLSRIEVKDRSTILEEMVRGGLLDADALEPAGEEEEVEPKAASKKGLVSKPVVEEDDEVEAKPAKAAVVKKKVVKEEDSDEWDE